MDRVEEEIACVSTLLRTVVHAVRTSFGSMQRGSGGFGETDRSRSPNDGPTPAKGNEELPESVSVAESIELIELCGQLIESDNNAYRVATILEQCQPELIDTLMSILTTNPASVIPPSSPEARSGPDSSDSAITAKSQLSQQHNSLRVSHGFQQLQDRCLVVLGKIAAIIGTSSQVISQDALRHLQWRSSSSTGAQPPPSHSLLAAMQTTFVEHKTLDIALRYAVLFTDNVPPSMRRRAIEVTYTLVTKLHLVTEALRLDAPNVLMDCAMPMFAGMVSELASDNPPPYGAPARGDHEGGPLRNVKFTGLPDKRIVATTMADAGGRSNDNGLSNQSPQGGDGDGGDEGGDETRMQMDPLYMNYVCAIVRDCTAVGAAHFLHEPFLNFTRLVLLTSPSKYAVMLVCDALRVVFSQYPRFYDQHVSEDWRLALVEAADIVLDRSADHVDAVTAMCRLLQTLFVLDAVATAEVSADAADGELARRKRSNKNDVGGDSAVSAKGRDRPAADRRFVELFLERRLYLRLLQLTSDITNIASRAEKMATFRQLVQHCHMPHLLDGIVIALNADVSSFSVLLASPMKLPPFQGNDDASRRYCLEGSLTVSILMAKHPLFRHLIRNAVRSFPGWVANLQPMVLAGTEAALALTPSGSVQIIDVNGNFLNSVTYFDNHCPTAWFDLDAMERCVALLLKQQANYTIAQRTATPSHPMASGVDYRRLYGFEEHIIVNQSAAGNASAGDGGSSHIVIAGARKHAVLTLAVLTLAVCIGCDTSSASIPPAFDVDDEAEDRDDPERGGRGNGGRRHQHNAFVSEDAVLDVAQAPPEPQQPWYPGGGGERLQAGAQYSVGPSSDIRGGPEAAYYDHEGEFHYSGGGGPAVRMHPLMQTDENRFRQRGRGDEDTRGLLSSFPPRRPSEHYDDPPRYDAEPGEVAGDSISGGYDRSDGGGVGLASNPYAEHAARSRHSKGPAVPPSTARGLARAPDGIREGRSTTFSATRAGRSTSAGGLRQRSQSATSDGLNDPHQLSRLATVNLQGRRSGASGRRDPAAAPSSRSSSYLNNFVRNPSGYDATMAADVTAAPIPAFIRRTHDGRYVAVPTDAVDPIKGGVSKAVGKSAASATGGMRGTTGAATESSDRRGTTQRIWR